MNYGTYEYFLNGKPTGVSETFDIRILPNGAKFTISIRKAKPFNTKITVKSIEKDEKFQRVEIRFVTESSIHAIYKFQSEKLLFVRENFTEKTTSETFDLPENYVFFPLMRCFQGKIILRVAEAEKFLTVLVPSIENPNDAENLLRPTFDERRAEFHDKESIAFYQQNSITYETNVYSYFSKHYDENSRFWIDDDGLLVAYRFVQSPDKIWEVFLSTDEHR